MKLKAEHLIDPLSEIHYAYHKSLGEITALHDHDFFEIFLITKGKASHNINGKDEVLCEGNLVFIRPKDKHRYSKFENENCELINLAFPASTIRQLFNYFGEGYGAQRLLKSRFPDVVHLPELEKNILISRFEKLNTIPRNNKKRIRTELRMFLAEIFSRYFSQEDYTTRESIPQWLMQVRREMQDKSNFKAGIKRMYEISGRTPEHFSRAFKKAFGETPTDYITSLRLNYAANLISNSDKDIIDCAMEAGFENLSHFYHLFKKQFKTTPREFRINNQKMFIPV